MDLETPLERALRKARVPQRLAHWRLPDFAKTPMEAAGGGDGHEVLDSWAAEGLGLGRGIALVGEPGRGKTALAVALLAAQIMRVPPPSMATDPDQPITTAPKRPYFFTTFTQHLARKQELMFMDKQGMSGSDEAHSLNLLIKGCEANATYPLYDVRCLVLDDMGKEHTTKSEWAEDVFDALLRERFDKGYPTIITSNIALLDWDDTYNRSMGSFAREVFVPVWLNGDDLR